MAHRQHCREQDLSGPRLSASRHGKLADRRCETIQVHPNDVFYECNGAGSCGTPAHYVPGQQWGLNKVGAPQAWKYTTGSTKVKVLVHSRCF